MTDIPARIMEEADGIMKDCRTVGTARVAIARALLAAERRARKEALEEAETVDQEAFAVFIRKWVKDRFGPWITYNTAKGAYSKFCEERAAIRALANEKEG